VVWQRVYPPDFARFAAIAAAGPEQAWAVGDFGSVFRWTAAGWERMETPVGADLTGVAAAAEDDVWACGLQGVVLHHDGERWSRVPGGPEGALSAISTPPGAGTAVWVATADGRVWRRSGGDWTSWRIPDAGPLLDVAGIDAATAYVVATRTGTQAPVLLRLEGDQWRGIDYGGVVPQVVAAGSAHNVWVADIDGAVFRFNGLSWERFELDEVVPHEIAVVSEDEVFVCWRNAISRWRGGIWETEELALYRPVGVAATPEGDAWFCSPEGWIFRLQNDQWLPELIPSSRPELLAMTATSGGALWAVGREGTILRLDQGAWESFPGVSEEDLHAVHTVNDNLVYAVGAAGTILRYTPTYGWQDESVGVLSTLLDVASLTNNHVWAVGDQGIVFHKTGGVWSEQAQGALGDAALHAVVPLAPDHVYALGALIAHYDGSSWSVDAPLVQAALSAYQVRPDDVWAGLRTFSRPAEPLAFLRFDGEQWFYQAAGGVHDVLSILGIDGAEGHIWAAGRLGAENDAGAVIHYDGRSWRVQLWEAIAFRDVAVLGPEQVYAAGSDGCIYFSADAAEPNPTLTPTPLVSPTQPPFPTATPTPPALPSPSPTMTPTPTRTPEITLGVRLSMPAHFFRAGDESGLEATLYSFEEPLADIYLVVFLDIGSGEYWFWPSWVRYPPDVDMALIPSLEGRRTETIIPSFTWPAGTGRAENLRFWGALLGSGAAEILGEIDSWTFGFAS
jgi:hypothetical protein